jgi:hypothetical protein
MRYAFPLYTRFREMSCDVRSGERLFGPTTCCGSLVRPGNKAECAALFRPTLLTTFSQIQ